MVSSALIHSYLATNHLSELWAGPHGNCLGLVVLGQCPEDYQQSNSG